VFLGIFWFGTILYTRIVLFPALAALPPDTYATARKVMVTGNAQMWTRIFSYGTVVLGILRGALTGVFARLTTAYGITYLVALVVGVFMIALLYAPWFSAPIWRKVYVGGFPVMFTLMVLMRFGL
jgi:hypothetical protein